MTHKLIIIINSFTVKIDFAWIFWIFAFHFEVFFIALELLGIARFLCVNSQETYHLIEQHFRAVKAKLELYVARTLVVNTYAGLF